MEPKYNLGQRVIIAPAGAPTISVRNAGLSDVVGQVGQVKDYHWISTGMGQNIFYLYTVQTLGDKKQLVLHEDELRAAI